MTKEAYYFSHDSNAQHDEKILLLRQKHGWEGYGIYWALVERLRDCDAFAMRSHYDSIAFDMQVQSDLIKSVIEDFDLFIIKKGFFYSESLKKRMELKQEKSEKARKSAQIRWGKGKNDANALPQQVNRNAIKESKVKEKKVNEIKEKKIKYSDFVSLSKTEYEKLVEKHGEKATESMIEILNNYKASKGKSYKSDYHAILNWVVSRCLEENKKDISTERLDPDISEKHGFKVCPLCDKSNGFYFTSKDDRSAMVHCNSCGKEFDIDL